MYDSNAGLCGHLFFADNKISAADRQVGHLTAPVEQARERFAASQSLEKQSVITKRERFNSHPWRANVSPQNQHAAKMLHLTAVLRAKYLSNESIGVL
jgi:hypothetical protein